MIYVFNTVIHKKNMKLVNIFSIVKIYFLLYLYNFLDIISLIFFDVLQYGMKITEDKNELSEINIYPGMQHKHTKQSSVYMHIHFLNLI